MSVHTTYPIARDTAVYMEFALDTIEHLYGKAQRNKHPGEVAAFIQACGAAHAADLLVDKIDRLENTLTQALSALAESNDYGRSQIVEAIQDHAEKLESLDGSIDALDSTLTNAAQSLGEFVDSAGSTIKNGLERLGGCIEVSAGKVSGCLRTLTKTIEDNSPGG